MDCNVTIVTQQQMSLVQAMIGKMEVKHKVAIVTFNFRPPIDSVKTKLDVVGLFNHCVTVKLADGSIIEQNIYPGSTHCQEIFLQSWKMLLNSQWNQVSKVQY